MACSCKKGSASKQVTSVKQVVKKTLTPSASRPTSKKNMVRRATVYRRHF